MVRAARLAPPRTFNITRTRLLASKRRGSAVPATAWSQGLCRGELLSNDVYTGGGKHLWLMLEYCEHVSA